MAINYFTFVLEVAKVDAIIKFELTACGQVPQQFTSFS